MENNDLLKIRKELKEARENTSSQLSIDLKIKKLKIANHLALEKLSKSKRRNLLDQAENTKEEIENKIKSIALSKFVFRKAQKLKKLGKQYQEINEIIEKLEQSETTVLDKVFEKFKTSFAGFGVDKRFVNLDVGEIIEQFGEPKTYKNIEVLKNPVDYNNFIEMFKEESNESEESNLEELKQEIKDEILEDLETNQENIGSTTNVTNVNNITNVKNETKEYVKVVKSNEKTVNIIQNYLDDVIENTTIIANSINKKPKYLRQINELLKSNEKDPIKSTLDVDKKIYDYLISIGEVDLANKVLDFLTDPEREKVKLSDLKENTKEVKRLANINRDIRKILRKIQEDLIDEQDTSIERITPKQIEKTSFGITGVGENVEKQKDELFGDIISTLMNSIGIGAGSTLAAGYGGKKLLDLAKKLPTSSKVPGQVPGRVPETTSKTPSKVLSKIQIPKSLKLGRKFLGTAAIGLTAYDIASDVVKKQEKIEQSDIRSERIKARTAQGAGLSGALVGAIAGGKAFASIGAFVGSLGFPGVGTLIGGLGGGIVGATTGAALGYYMGDSVSDYIAKMFTEPLDELPDNKRENPFVAYVYLKKNVIPEMQKAIVSGMSIPEEDRKKAGIDIESLQDKVGDYAILADELIKPENIQKWFKKKIKDAGLSNTSYITKRKYLYYLIEQFRDTEFYDLAKAQIENVVPEEYTGVTSVLNKLTFGLLGERNANENIDDPEMRLREERALKVAQELEYFNLTNTLGKNGETITLSNDASENYEKLIRSGIIISKWGSNNDEISEDGINKLKQLPIKQLELLLEEDSLSDQAEEQIKKIISEKRKSEQSIQKLSPKPLPSAFETEGINYKKYTYTIKKPILPNKTNPDDYDIKDLFILNKVDEESVNALNPTLLSNLKAMAAEYYDIYGEKIQINSAYRSFEEQQKIKEKYGRRAAAPGKSMHNFGLAVDLNTNNVNKAISAGLFEKYGFTRPVPGETWHVEPEGIPRKEIQKYGLKYLEQTDVMALNKSPSVEGKKSESEGITPDVVKTENPNIVNTSASSTSNKENAQNSLQDVKIKSIQARIRSLENLVQSARNRGDEETAKYYERKLSLEKVNLKLTENQIQETNNYEINKARQVQNIEDKYAKNIESTVNYDTKTVVNGLRSSNVATNGQSVQVAQNIALAENINKKGRPIEMFAF